MIEEIQPNLFRVEVPLPNSPLKFLNSYVIRSSDRNLIVDTGLNRKECLDAMQAGLKHLEIDLKKTDFFITHLHADHFALLSKLATPESNVFFNRPETEIIEATGWWDEMLAYAKKNGFPENELHKAFQSHPGRQFGSDWIPELKILLDGDQILVGDFSFKCVSTPGHSLGHTCLYEPDRKILIAGDHILIDITPNIQCWRDEQDPLRDYLASLDKVNALEIDLVLPGHRRLITEHRKRIAELKEHHRLRLEEVLSILSDGALTAYEVASLMTWDLGCKSWNDFPVQQKWFATGEAIAHLRHLETEKAIVEREKEVITST
ncbi:MAG: MBL fold metallo-hydrolase [Desulfobacteraceae bacterium]|nr:MAG: MBL fold metallo-hydrolase [Desulfobacteraceae bacterium]